MIRTEKEKWLAWLAKFESTTFHVYIYISFSFSPRLSCCRAFSHVRGIWEKEGRVVVGRKAETGKGGRTTIIYHKGERWRVRKEINNEEWMNARRITTWLKGRVSTKYFPIRERGKNARKGHGL